MKRCILLLLCILLLAGCVGQPPEETESTIPSSEGSQTLPPGSEPGLYVPDSEPEQNTHSAIRQYRAESGIISGMAPMGERLLLLSTVENTTLTLLEGENLKPCQSVELDCVLHLPEVSVQVREDGIGFYDNVREAMVFLDENLQETAVIPLPENMQGLPVLSPDWKQVFYCTQAGIQALDLQTGFSRVLKETACEYQNILGLYCDGSILEFSGSRDDGTAVTCFLSTQDGETVYTTEQPPSLTTIGNWYFAAVWDGSVEQYLFGTPDGTEKCLYPAEDGGMAVPLAVNTCLIQTTNDAGCVMDYYDLTSGRKTASVCIPGFGVLWDLTIVSEKGTVYFTDSNSSGEVFYSWDISKSQITDENSYTDIRRTAENPDTEGLAECRKWAERLEQAYGVDIRIWDEALEVHPFDYIFTEEYQVPAYRRDLAALEKALSQYPEGFFQCIEEGTGGELHICLVREVLGNAEWGSLDSAVGVQFWDGNDTYITLAVGLDVERFFYHELCHVIDSRVLESSSLYDDWEALNPDGFRYDYDYITNQNREDYICPEEETRAFIDSYSMSFPKEDRARIMEYAMLPNNESYFISDIMQQKLQRISLAIRKTFELEEYPGALLWEQYLRGPLTPDA